jgi:hypothetical protein
MYAHEHGRDSGQHKGCPYMDRYRVGAAFMLPTEGHPPHLHLDMTWVG